MVGLINRYLKRDKRTSKAIPDHGRRVAPELDVFPEDKFIRKEQAKAPELKVFREKEKVAEAEEEEAEEAVEEISAEEVKLTKLVVPGPTTKEKQARVKAAIKTQKENIKIVRSALRQAKSACTINIRNVQDKLLRSKELLRNLKQQKKSRF